MMYNLPSMPLDEAIEEHHSVKCLSRALYILESHRQRLKPSNLSPSIYGPSPPHLCCPRTPHFI